MRAAYRRSEASIWDGALAAPADVPPMPLPAVERAVYGGRATNWPLIVAIVALHAALIVTLIKLDVIHVIRRTPPPTIVTLLPDMAPPPPPAAPPEPEVMPLKPVEPKLAPPVAIVQTPAPSPLAMAAAPPVPITAVAVPVVAHAEPGPPALITPPDFNADQLDNPAPRYPLESRRAHEQGTVTVKVLVNATGRPEQIKLASSSGFDRLDRAALDAIRRWKFVPAKQAGQAVQAWVLVPIPFVLAG